MLHSAATRTRLLSAAAIVLGEAALLHEVPRVVPLGLHAAKLRCGHPLPASNLLMQRSKRGNRREQDSTMIQNTAALSKLLSLIPVHSLGNPKLVNRVYLMNVISPAAAAAAAGRRAAHFWHDPNAVTVEAAVATIANVGVCDKSNVSWVDYT
jgi:hypothetical protein